MASWNLALGPLLPSSPGDCLRFETHAVTG